MYFSILDRSRHKFFESQEVADVVRKQIVILAIGILCPAVEAPIRERKLFSIADEDRAGVASPDAVGRPTMKSNGRRECAAFAQDRARPPFRGSIVHDDVDLLHAREVTNNLRVNMRNAGELAWPIALVVRPCDPGGLV